jgi:hypothetical protein
MEMKFLTFYAKREEMRPSDEQTLKIEKLPEGWAHQQRYLLTPREASA